MNDDTYGSLLREDMKRSMEQPLGWRPLNRRDGYDKTMAWGSVVLGIIALGLLAICLTHEVLLRWH